MCNSIVDNCLFAVLSLSLIGGLSCVACFCFVFLLLPLFLCSRVADLLRALSAVFNSSFPRMLPRFCYPASPRHALLSDRDALCQTDRPVLGSLELQHLFLNCMWPEGRLQACRIDCTVLLRPSAKWTLASGLLMLLTGLQSWKELGESPVLYQFPVLVLLLNTWLQT